MHTRLQVNIIEKIKDKKRFKKGSENGIVEQRL